MECLQKERGEGIVISINDVHPVTEEPGLPKPWTLGDTRPWKWSMWSFPGLTGRLLPSLSPLISQSCFPTVCSSEMQVNKGGKKPLCLNKEPAFLFSAGRLSFRNRYCTVPWPPENKMGLACFQCGWTCGRRESCLKVYFRDKITALPVLHPHHHALTLMDYCVFPSIN